jgi:dienelactone hydrolase
MISRWFCLLGTLSALSVSAAVDKIGRAPELPDSMPWDLVALGDVPEFRWVKEKGPIRSLIYAGETYFNEPTEVFAFYATPETIGGNVAGENDYPAVVLVHGGGGTAFAEWVWMWANRGYAAIAMDLSGHRPPSPLFEKETGEFLEDRGLGREFRTMRKQMAAPGPGQGHPEKFGNIGGEVDDDWPFHAISAVIRAHTLVRSFREVDHSRTAITGISWGGYTTCIVASIDSRFAAAVPVYGCGFLHEGESVQKPAIEQSEFPEEWVKLYDPSSYLGACRVPIMFVNGNRDKHYPLDSYSKSYDLVQGAKTIRIEVGMGHSHPAGWAPEEIGRFIDSHCKGDDSLVTLGKPIPTKDGIELTYEAAVPLKSAALHYTADSGPQVKRVWKQSNAKIEDGKITSGKPPAGTTVWLISTTDQRDALVTSEVVFPKKSQPVPAAP